MPKYLVETISMFRIRYIVDAKEADHATDEVVMKMRNNNLKEFSQEHLDEIISSVREIGPKEYIRLFDEDNTYLKDWPAEKKFAFINVIDYDAE
jgi:hypothetical protein